MSEETPTSTPSSSTSTTAEGPDPITTTGPLTAPPTVSVPVLVPFAMPAPLPPQQRYLRWAFLAFVLLVIVVFNHVVMPFVLGALIAFILAPIVKRTSGLRVAGRSVPRGVAIVLVYVVLSLGLFGLGRALLPLIAEDVGRLVRETPAFVARIQSEYIPEAEAWLQSNLPAAPGLQGDAEPRPESKLRITPRRNGDFEVSFEGLELEIEPAGKGRYLVGPRRDGDDKKTRLGELFSQAVSSTETQLRSVLAFGQRFAAGVLRGIAWFVLMFMVAAYLLIDLDRVLGFFRSLIPPEHRADTDKLSREIERGLDGVIRGQLLICVLNGVLTTIGLLLFQVKYALLLGLVAGAMSFIPVFGSILSSVPIVLVALTSGADRAFALSKGVGMLIWILVIHFFEANLFNPKIIGTAAKIHPIIVIFALLIGEESGGLLGALVAVPIASIVQALFVFFRAKLLVEPPEPTA